MKTITLLFSVLLSSSLFSQNTYGDIIGTLQDSKKEGIYGATVSTNYGEAVYRVKTEYDGSFRLSAIPAGTYVITFKVDTTTMLSKEVEVSPDGFGDLGIVTFINPAEQATNLGVVDIESDRIHLKRGVAPEIKLSRKDILKSPGKFDIKSLVTGMTSEVHQADDGSLVFRGARKGDLIYYIDGVKMGATQNIPSASMGQVLVYSGAIPAKYGDTNGGVIVVETISYFDLYRDWKARQ